MVDPSFHPVLGSQLYHASFHCTSALRITILTVHSSHSPARPLHAVLTTHHRDIRNAGAA